eukprot:8348503-Heterocapsa_arctica.AAC.1
MPLSGRLYEDDEDEEEDLKFVTVGSLLDHCWITVSPLLEHFWSTRGALMDRFWDTFLLRVFSACSF